MSLVLERLAIGRMARLPVLLHLSLLYLFLDGSISFLPSCASAISKGLLGQRACGRCGDVMVVVLVLLALAFWLSGPTPGVSPVIDFMRKMALTAGVWTVLVLGVARFYGIRIGQNTWGMAIGFLIFVSSEIANFAAFDLSSWFIPIWRFVHPFAYVFMLAVWTWLLWDYAPNPQNETDSSLGPLLLSEWQRQSAALDKTIRKVIQP